MNVLTQNATVIYSYPPPSMKARLGNSSKLNASSEVMANSCREPQIQVYIIADHAGLVIRNSIMIKWEILITKKKYK